MTEMQVDQAQATLLSPPQGTAIRQGDTANLLLRSMHPDDFSLLAPFLRRVPIQNGDCLAQAGALVETACFPEAGLAGFLDVLEDDRRLAIGLLGREGFVGWPSVMGNDRWPHEVIARGQNATALQLSSSELVTATLASARLHNLLLRFASTFAMQMSRTIVSNLIHSIEQRTARWLLLYHDRLDSDDLVLTHEELGAMLGVRRASVTDALHLLEANGCIRGTRGKVLIRDRAALVALTSETYGQAEAEYERLIAPAVSAAEAPPALFD